jgi:lysine 2,3-aminomutase
LIWIEAGDLVTGDVKIEWSDWKWQIKNSIRNAKQLEKQELLKLSPEKLKEVEEVTKVYPMCISPYYFSLVKEVEDPIGLQAIPRKEELVDTISKADPLHEETDSPVPGLTHRYPDRVLLKVSNRCGMYCRFCTRKRMVGGGKRSPSKENIDEGIEYIKKTKQVRDVIISGGDPFLLETHEIEEILQQVRAIDHVEIIRLGTRTPCTLPQRITPELCNMLKKYHPLYVNVHFEHPNEITEESKRACAQLVDAGIPLANQSVLLNKVNDSVDVMKQLVHKLLQIKVRPYYMFHADLVKGTEHFWTDVHVGVDIIEHLRGWTSGIAVPTYVVDSVGGGGKIPVTPNYVKEIDDERVVLRNYQNREFVYPARLHANQDSS